MRVTFHHCFFSAALVAAVGAGCGDSGGGSGGSGGTASSTSTGSSSSKASGAGSTGATGTGGTGGGAPLFWDTPICTGLPATAPSMGSCVPASSPCNPVTNEGCPADGSSCDFDGDMGFKCYAPPNDAAICMACDPMNGPFCAPGSTCFPTDMSGTRECLRYCCTDADCGGTAGSCDLGINLAAGVCGTPSG